MSTLRTNNIANVAGTQSTDVLNVINGSAKAWVNFNGTGTVAIRAGYNVSSITDNGVGDYTVNFTTAMSDSNYSMVATCGMTSSTYSVILGTPSLIAATTTSRRFSVNAPVSGAGIDFAEVNIAIFR